MSFILRRLGWTVVVMWFVVTATFAMVVAVPADPMRAMLGPHATPDSIERARAHYCLDEGVVRQYGCWLANLGRGDLGESYRTKRPVAQILGDRVWPTVQLALAALLISLAFGVPIGVLSAVRRGRWPDRVATAIGLVAQSAPSFFIGPLLIYVVAYRWDLLPLSGYGDGGWDRVRHVLLPALTLAAIGIAYYARVVRNELGETLTEDYVRTARAKGLRERDVVLRHALRPAAGPLVTLLGLDLGMLLGGAVVVESIFSWPGLGREVLQAILEVDLPVILGVVIVTAAAIAVANLVVDLVQLALDPRLGR
ncbi:MAG: ABC transporter permease [Kofleriaceae bacterium]